MEIIQSEGSFVWLEHTKQEGPHYDLVLEGFQLCPTFQFQTLNSINGSRIKDHRKIYLTFEGQISPEKGSVKICEKGLYTFDGVTLTLINSTAKLQYALIDNKTLQKK